MRRRKPEGAVTYTVFCRDTDPEHDNGAPDIADALAGLGIWADTDGPTYTLGSSRATITVGPDHVNAAKAIANAMRLRLWARHDPGPKGEEADACGFLPCPKCGGCPSGDCECSCPGTRGIKASLHVKLRTLVDRKKARVKRAKLPRRTEVG